MLSIVLHLTIYCGTFRTGDGIQFLWMHGVTDTVSEGNTYVIAVIGAVGREDYPANIPTRYWLTPSGVKLPTSEKTSEIKSGLV